jgi:PmbA protein
MAVFDQGVLKSYYIDVYYGRKLGSAPTTGINSNVVFPAGKKGQAELMKDVKEGVLITSFLGGNSNTTTGDYSFGFQGSASARGSRRRPWPR